MSKIYLPNSFKDINKIHLFYILSFIDRIDEFQVIYQTRLKDYSLPSTPDTHFYTPHINKIYGFLFPSSDICDAQECNFYAVCESFGNGETRCVCPEVCIRVSTQVGRKKFDCGLGKENSHM